MSDTAGAGVHDLDRHLTLVPATALAVTTVVGGGALVLPGAALRHAGANALLGWILAALITIPLIAVFARLGARYPSAGGVAGFVQAAFGRHSAAGVEVVLIGAFGLGMPAIALSGGGYLAAVFGWSPGYSWLGALILVALAAGMLLSGGRVSSKVQAVLAATLTIGLAAAGVVGLVNGHAHFAAPSVTGSGSWTQALAVVGIVFFAFTGWEVVAFTTAEYRNPQRDFPRAVAISFIVVVGVYMLVAAGVQATLDVHDPATESSPVAAVIRVAVSPTAASLVAVLGVVILGANLIGALWGASRLVYSSASHRLLPHRLSLLTGAQRTPSAAIIAVTVLFAAVITASALGVMSPTTMFMVAGQNFFMLYLLSAVVFVKVAHSTAARVWGVVIALGLAVVVVLGFHWQVVIYAAILFGLGYLLSRLRRTAEQG
ncbi:APC family permease [Amycolatopsis pithecellobii]|uniref:Amino acid permease n=1 Tax=Amycolatopsis pithecellobii TaxID=664692 RepID=A0A6N7YKB7_9PSEU|nr:amino acid permease [Amycolatopsis pithecellobii]MTD53355.1 amino acid permease [Amycolatopsis pithecellobii]